MEETSKRGRGCHYEAADLLRCVHGTRGDNTLIARRSQSYQPRRNRRNRKARGLRFRSICTLVPPSTEHVQEVVQETANIERETLECQGGGRFKLSVAKGREKTKAGIERTRRKLNRITVFGSWSSTMSKNEPQSVPVRRTQRRSGHDFSADFITQAEIRHRPDARDLLFEEEFVETIAPFACIATPEPKSTSRVVVGQTKRH